MYWYSNSYRRHLLDMHINDWHDGRFLSEFSPETYYENLKRANVKSAMIYLQSHIGYCYYPTKCGHMHSAFSNDPYAMRKLVNLCHNGGIDVVAYYSINYNTIESQHHPDWQTIDILDGQKQSFSGSRYGHCCPNNLGYIDFVLKQIKEILEFAPFEGIFFDMPFWAKPCYCEQCSERYRKNTGRELPKSREDADWEHFMDVRETWTDEYINKITSYVKKISPKTSVEYNYAFAALNAVEIIRSEVINRYNDYAAGDIYMNYFTQSFACKFYSAVTKNKPFEYMTGRCDPNLSVHTITRSDDKLRLSMMLTVAHHGANFVIDAIDPIGTMNAGFYDKLGKLYDEVEAYEPYLDMGEPVEDIGVFYIFEGRSTDDNPLNHYNSTINTAKILKSNHIPYGIVTQATLRERINRFKTVIVSKPSHLTADSIEILKDFVSGGGVLYFSGADDTNLLKELLGTETEREYDYKYSYLSPQEKYADLFEGFSKKYPVSIRSGIPIVGQIENAEVLAKVALPYIHPTDSNQYSSIHSDPPGTYLDNPAVVIKSFEKGKVIWSAVNFEANLTLCYQKILLNLLKYAGICSFSVSSDADSDTELVAFRSDKNVLISAVYVTDAEKTSIRPPFEIKVESKKPKKVSLLPDGIEIPFLYENGVIRFTTRPLNIFAMYKIDL